MNQAPPETRVVQVVRAFRHERKVIGVGSVVELPTGVANNVISGGKAYPVDPATQRQANSDLPDPPAIAEPSPSVDIGPAASESKAEGSGEVRKSRGRPKKT